MLRVEVAEQHADQPAEQQHQQQDDQASDPRRNLRIRQAARRGAASTSGPNFQAAQIATIQNASDTASRTNPRNSPMTVEPSRTNTMRTSAPVKLSP